MHDSAGECSEAQCVCDREVRLSNDQASASSGANINTNRKKKRALTLPGLLIQREIWRQN